MIGDSDWPCAAVVIVIVLALAAMRIAGPEETCERTDGTPTVTTRTSAVGGVGVEGARRGSSGGAVSDER